MSETVLTRREGAIAILMLNRPEKMNAYSLELHNALIAATDAADKDPDVRVIVITGAGKMFCAGADLESGFSGAGLKDGPEVIDGISRDYGGMLVLRLWECDTPVIGAVNGTAVGIGATMLLPMDIVIAAKKSKMGFPFARRGIVFDGASSWFLPKIVGLTRARRWITTGEIFKSEEALAAGMVSELCDAADVLPRALDIAREIAEHCAPQSMAKNKQLLRASLTGQTGYGGGPMGAHMMESEMLTERFKSADCREGILSFFQKRAPEFEPDER